MKFQVMNKIILMFVMVLLTTLFTFPLHAISYFGLSSNRGEMTRPFNAVPLLTTENLPAALSGKIITKETGETVPGATIYVPDLRNGTTSDADGFYKLKNLPKAKLLVQVSFLGYKTIVETIDFATTTTKDFVLEQTITEVHEVVITGTSSSSEIKRNPVPILVMDRKSIDQVMSTNIIDAISELPGIDVVTTGPNVSKPFIHGMGYNRVLTLVDGIRQEGQQWGDEHGIEVDDNSINKVEIIKGPASLTYGSDALAGVVNLIPFSTVSPGEFNGTVSTFYQSNNKLFGSSASIDANNNGLVWGGRMSYKQATNYKNRYDGRVYGTAFAETNASGYLGLNKKWGYSHLNFSAFNNLQMIPDGSRDSLTRKFTRQITEADTFRPIVPDEELDAYKIGTLHQHIQHYKVYSSNNIIFGESKLGLTLGYQQNIRQEFSHPQAAAVAGLYLVLNTFTYDAKYHFPDRNGLETTMGLNGMAQVNQNKGTEFIIPDYHLFDIGPFLHLKKSMEKLDLSAGIRFDSRFFSNDEMFVAKDPSTGFDMQVSSTSTLPKEKTFTKYAHSYYGLSGSAGISYRVNEDLTIKANIARGFRAPNILEISASGVHPGTNIYQIGNLDFKPEFSLQEDLAIFYSHGHFKGSIELFNADISNYIFNQKILNHLGKDSIIVSGTETFKFQQSSAHLYGGEISFDIHPHPLDWLHFENSVSFIYGVNKGTAGVSVANDAKYLPFIPPFHSHSELRADITQKFKFCSAIYAKIEMEYYAMQDRVYFANNTETVTPGYKLFNAGIGTDLLNKKGKTICSIHISGNNITDVAYQSHLSRLKYFEEYPNNGTGRRGIYNMGRNIGFKLLFPFGIVK
jgi:iron complex outermembrane receptor protein